MTQELEEAFARVANQFTLPDDTRPGEWKCRLCGGLTEPDGPVVHTSECNLSVLHQLLIQDTL